MFGEAIFAASIAVFVAEANPRATVYGLLFWLF
jgi:hypothetical protein